MQTTHVQHAQSVRYYAHRRAMVLTVTGDQCRFIDNLEPGLARRFAAKLAGSLPVAYSSERQQVWGATK